MTTSLIWDLALVVLILVVIVIGYRRGFLTSLISLVGMAASCIVAAILSPQAAAWVYDNYLAESLQASISQSLSEKLSAFANLLNSLGLGDSISSAANDSLRTVMVALLTIVAFLIIFLLAMLIVRLLIRATRSVNHVPVLGGINRLFGGALGACEAFLLCYVIGLAVTLLVSFSRDQWSWINTAVIEDTKLLGWFIQYKLPF